MNKTNMIHDSSLFLKSGGDDIYNIAVKEGGLCIDGGAAAGFVTKILLKGPECKVFSFEPFPGNIPHFIANVGDNPRVSFFQKAIGNYNGPGRFFVRSIVDGNQAGWNHLPGYSSEGYLCQNTDGANTGKQFYDVEVVRLDSLINEKITLLKLDLQGGEYDAIVGLGDKISQVKFCYVEFSLDWRIIDILAENGFVLFDTEYTGIPKVPIEEIDGLFCEMTVINLSNGYKAVKGVIKNLPRDLHSYHNFIEQFKSKYFHHLWSDIIAVNKSDLKSFFNASVE